jgi:hypothetical protein
MATLLCQLGDSQVRNFIYWVNGVEFLQEADGPHIIEARSLIFMKLGYLLPSAKYITIDRHPEPD